jgi:hypothetical protein
LSLHYSSVILCSVKNVWGNWRGLMSYLRYLCLFVCSGVQHMLCCVFLYWFCLSSFLRSVEFYCCTYFTEEIGSYLRSELNSIEKFDLFLTFDVHRFFLPIVISLYPNRERAKPQNIKMGHGFFSHIWWSSKNVYACVGRILCITRH